MRNTNVKTQQWFSVWTRTKLEVHTTTAVTQHTVIRQCKHKNVFSSVLYNICFKTIAHLTTSEVGQWTIVLRVIIGYLFLCFVTFTGFETADVTAKSMLRRTQTEYLSIMLRNCFVSVSLKFYFNCADCGQFYTICKECEIVLGDCWSARRECGWFWPRARGCNFWEGVDRPQRKIGAGPRPPYDFHELKHQRRMAYPDICPRNEYLCSTTSQAGPVVTSHTADTTALSICS